MDVKLRLLAVALAALAVCAPPAAAAPGDLDASFSGDGRVSTLTSPDTFVARAVAMQPDGRIVVAGYSCNTGTCGPTGDSSFRLLRYTSDGGLDTDFGQGGMVTTAVGVGRSQAFDVIVRADGTIVAGGVASADALDPGSFALVGYKPNGTLDTTFGTGGRVITRVGRGLRRDLRPRAGLRRPLHRGRSGQRRRARPLRARPLRPPRQARPELRRHGDASSCRPRRPTPTARPARSCPTAASSRSARPATTRRPRACASAARRSASAAARRRPGSARSARPTRTPTPRSRWPTGACCRRASPPSGSATPRWRSCARARPACSTARGTATGSRWRAPATAPWPADVVLDAEGRAVAAGDATIGADHAFAVARFDGAGALDRSFGGGDRAHELPRHLARPRHRDRPAGRRQARGGGHRVQRRAAARSAAAAPRGSRSPATWRRRPRGAAPGRRHAAAGGSGARGSSRCPRG